MKDFKYNLTPEAAKAFMEKMIEENQNLASRLSQAERALKELLQYPSPRVLGSEECISCKSKAFRIHDDGCEYMKSRKIAEDYFKEDEKK